MDAPSEVPRSDNPPAPAAAARDGKALIDATRPYASDDTSESWRHLIVVLLVLASSIASAAAAPYWPLRLAAAVIAGLTTVRVFIVYHKKIGIMYGAVSLFFFLVGGCEALLIRLQLAAPDNTILGAGLYNEMFTMHATTMVFLFVMPMAAAFANYFLPLQIGINRSRNGFVSSCNSSFPRCASR